MITDAVRGAEGDVPPEQRRPGGRDKVTDGGDPVADLLQALHRAGSDAPVGARVRRRFDVQYWACWAAAVMFLVTMTYLWITH